MSHTLLPILKAGLEFIASSVESTNFQVSRPVFLRKFEVLT